MLFFHVLVSLLMLVPGFIVIRALLRSEVPRGWTIVYFTLAVLTSATGFLLPAQSFLPSHGVGIISLLLLGAASFALYMFNFAGPWRWIYGISVVLSVYFDVFVAVVQAFQKIPFLNAFAPTGAELPFVIAQLAVLAIFVWLCVAAFRRFRPAPALV